MLFDAVHESSYGCFSDITLALGNVRSCRVKRTSFRIAPRSEIGPESDMPV
jgi:hypothetical protein